MPHPNPSKETLYQRAQYALDPGKKLRQNKARRAKLRTYVADLKCAPCTDCGGRFHPVVMDFHHTRGDKHNEISNMVSAVRPLAILQAEIAKCDLVCSNCHRLRTHNLEVFGLGKAGTP